MRTLKKYVTVVAALSLTAASMVPAPANDEIGVVRGKTIGEWSGKWWQWAFSFPEGFPNSEPFKSEEVDCSAGQRGLVWFLAGTGVASNEPPPGPGEPLKRKCKTDSEGHLPLLSLTKRCALQSRRSVLWARRDLQGRGEKEDSGRTIQRHHSRALRRRRYS